ncbi:MAG TPA: DUF1501 domain-containing protein [Tepidisphaeraceae bacterium]|nr:DUF1501 domain-containing protein [Tepidisphaeraceae bacterium]
MSPIQERLMHLTRRQFFGTSGLSCGSLAMALLGAPNSARGNDKRAVREHPALPGFPHHQPTAKAVIYLHMNGGPSQIDTWDYKPNLVDQFNKELPDSIRQGQRLTTMTSGQAKFPVAPSKYKFVQSGECGMWANPELLPFTSKLVDELAVVKTVHTNAINHDPACTFVMTGSEVPGKPSIGSWLSYGLGSENNDLPAFVVFTPRFPAGSNGQAIFSRMWTSGFLPTKHAGVALRSIGDPVLYLRNPDGVTAEDRRHMLDGLNKLNAMTAERLADPETRTRIAQYEMAFRMQTSVPELVDLSKETKETLELYGPEVTKPGSFAHSALMARRLVERGVRVVQILHRGWDSHLNLPKELGNQCKDTDQATAALLTDLKRIGLLDSTLVVWGGEFGRTVYCQGALTKDNYGRDHHPRNFAMWLAGGGVKKGVSFGETDDFSYSPVKDAVHINDLNATILHCLGIDHEKFTFKFQGLDQRLTGVELAKVVNGILA